MSPVNDRKAELRKKIEAFTEDENQRKILINLIEKNPDLEELISKNLSELSKSGSFVKSGSPSSSSSSPVEVRRNDINSSFYTRSPYSTSSSPIGSGYSGGRGGCFIATAAFGSPLSEKVQILKSFRDNYLQKNFAGKAFISVYYKFSPAIATYISGHSFLKNIVRKLLLPVIWFCKQFR